MQRRSFLFAKPPHWKPNLLEQHLLPVDLCSWLTETGSLTNRLREKYNQHFGLDVLLSEREAIFVNESKLLSLPVNSHQLVREVVLNSNDVTMVMARTILPEQTLKIARNKLSHLGNKPLGEIIFAYPDLELRNREFSLVDIDTWSPELRKRINIPERIWGRRTVYAINNQPLLVAEFFLPSLFLSI